jgi:hypothetical protein
MYYPPTEYAQLQYDPDLFVSPNSTVAQMGLTSVEVRELLEHQERWLREEYQQEQGVHTPTRETDYHQRQHGHNNTARVPNPPAPDHRHHTLNASEVLCEHPVSAMSQGGDLINRGGLPNHTTRAESPQRPPYPSVYIHPNSAAAECRLTPAEVAELDAHCAPKQDEWLEATYGADRDDRKVHKSRQEQKGYIAGSQGNEDKEIEETSRGASVEWNGPDHKPSHSSDWLVEIT